MTTIFDNKASILADFAIGYFDEPEFADFISNHSDTFTKCQAYIREEIDYLDDNERNDIDKLFAVFLDIVEAEDGEYEDIDDVFTAHYDGDELVGLYKPGR